MSEVTLIKKRLSFRMSEKSQTIGDFSFCRPSQILPIYRIKPVFHMSGKSQTIGDFTFSRPSQILPIYRIIARSLSQILPIMNLAENGKCAKNWVLNTNVTAFIQQHWCTRAVLRRSQYICVLALVNARFSILKKQKPTKNTIFFFFLLGQEIRDSNDSNFRETPCLFVLIYDRGTKAQQIHVGDW